VHRTFQLALIEGENRLRVTAASEQAQESKQLGHGVLSYALLAGLKAIETGPLEGQYVRPVSPDRVVDVMEWLTFAAGQVPRVSGKLFGASQDVHYSIQGQSFPILPLEN